MVVRKHGNHDLCFFSNNIKTTATADLDYYAKTLLGVGLWPDMGLLLTNKKVAHSLTFIHLVSSSSVLIYAI